MVDSESRGVPALKGVQMQKQIQNENRGAVNAGFFII